MKSMPFICKAMRNFDAKCVAKRGVPLGEPIPVKKEKRGKMGANPQLTQYLIALDIDMHHHIIDMVE